MAMYGFGAVNCAASAPAPVAAAVSESAAMSPIRLVFRIHPPVLPVRAIRVMSGGDDGT